MNKQAQTDSGIISSPGCVACVTGGRSEGLATTVWMSHFEVILFPAPIFAQHSVGLVQLHEEAVQRWVGWVTVWVQLHDEWISYSHEI